MTESERQLLRERIDEARRGRVAASIDPLCGFCREEMQPHPHGQLKRFCSTRCRVRFWYRLTDSGQAYARRKRVSVRCARPPAELTHGLNGYKRWGCRCEICRAANTAQCRAYRARRRAAA